MSKVQVDVEVEASVCVGCLSEIQMDSTQPGERFLGKEWENGDLVCDNCWERAEAQGDEVEVEFGCGSAYCQHCGYELDVQAELEDGESALVDVSCQACGHVNCYTAVELG